MTDPQLVLAEGVQRALAAAFGQEYAAEDPLIRPSQFADYQANVAMSLARRLGRSPREVAQAIAAHLDIPGTVEISGPGFLNLTLSDGWLAERAGEQLTDERLGVPAEAQKTVIVDYSAPNAAKEMHVGHLRTTVVGDALARVQEHLGHRVIRQNHLGDWGTPFGMLIEHLLDIGEEAAVAQLSAGAGNDYYQAARVKFDTDPAFAERARARVVTLQAEDPETMRLWHLFMGATIRYFNKVYTQLGVTLTDDDIAGESMYNSMLAQVCDDLQERGIAVISDGALCVFPPGFTGREGQPLPFMIRKSDGGYGYATTDMATMRYRVQDLKADRMLYVIGATQSLHMQMLFASAQMAGWLPEHVQAEHVQIGSVLGSDGKMFKTRAGKSIKLLELLEEGESRAAAVLADRDYDAATRAEIGQAVGMGAIKYADLSVSHDSEYVFDFDRMLALTGNTGPYLQYATARIRSIFRRGEYDPAATQGPIRIGHPAERALALQLLGFGAVVAEVGAENTPHRLCAFLFDTASAFTTFYENCPVLKADSEEDRQSRLALAALTLRVLTQGLDLLGIEVPERM
ncbi:arginine--tRNA ligase [Acrocarpospora phusangensis]|uniref:Arginine--tRNA ligase n=1 Tax=Acrocarpospora phusangensis TaxID=1070424 RepID=A0A919UPI9_9ACTN|nr:arginine--tRNA ligase [Acrocarpospora phusangensis]GIH29716.1 arginine--tRNA ligase [Acrocarpospora phusangensis]